MRRSGNTVALLTVLTAVLLIPTRAEARMGIVIFNHGEDIKEIGAVVDEHVEDVREATGTSPSVGFIHDGFGLFWLNVWTWNGRYCLYEGDQYWELEPAYAALLLGVAQSELSSPLFYRFPPGLFALVGIGVLIGVAKIFSVRREKALGRLFEDERYRRALDLIRERTAASTEDEKAVDDDAAFAKGFEDAVNYLNGEGVPADQARENLVTMINVIAESQQQAAA